MFMANVVVAYAVMTDVVMAYVVMAYVVIVYVVMAYGVMDYIIMAYIVLAYVVLVYVVLAYILIAYIVMAYVVVDTVTHVHGGMGTLNKTSRSSYGSSTLQVCPGFKFVHAQEFEELSRQAQQGALLADEHDGDNDDHNAHGAVPTSA